MYNEVLIFTFNVKTSFTCVMAILTSIYLANYNSRTSFGNHLRLYIGEEISEVTIDLPLNSKRSFKKFENNCKRHSYKIINKVRSIHLKNK